MQHIYLKKFTAMKTTTKYLTAICSVALILFFVSCSKENSVKSSTTTIPNGQSKLSVHLMDGPMAFAKVLVDIRQIAVLVDTATSQSADDDDHEWDGNYCGRGRDNHNKSLIWDTLSVKPGLYDLLKLRNGADTLLGSGLYVSGKILYRQHNQLSIGNIWV
jgi:hypothetical protein